jgi:SdrD B-like domain/WxL domain surface cell wall-binding
MLDTTRGYGFIEYKIKSVSTAVGLYGTNVTMTGNFGTITAEAQRTIDIIGCGTRNPTNWQRNLTLGDAELRSDQDFTCNFTPKICPVVFNDLDNDGIQSVNETNVGGQTISLYREDGVTLVTTIVTNAAGTVCFDSIAGGGAIYKVENPNPITPYNTTGGNLKTVTIGSNDAITVVKFGFSSGTLALSVPVSVAFPASTTSSVTQTRCTEINPIQVTDTRGDQPGWSVTAVVDNFADLTNTKTLLVANKFRSEPGTLTVISGLSGPQVGNSKTVASPTDAFTLMSVGAGQGKGVYRLNQSICQILDPYTVSGDYRTIITFTII